jgi:hypothetical protein
MKLKHVDVGHPKYEEYWQVLKKTLVERDHRDQCWADLGEKESYYAHDAASQIRNTSTNSTSNFGKAHGKGKALEGVQGVLNAEPEIIHEEWEKCFQLNNILLSAQKLLGKAAKEMRQQSTAWKIMKRAMGDLPDNVDKEMDGLAVLMENLNEFIEHLELLEGRFKSHQKTDVSDLKLLAVEMQEASAVGQAHVTGWKSKKVELKALSLTLGATAVPSEVATDVE